MEDQRAEELWYEYHMRVDGPEWFKQFDCPMKGQQMVTAPKTSEEIANDLVKFCKSQNDNSLLSLMATLAFGAGHTEEG